MCGNVPSRAWNLLAGLGRRALYFGAGTMALRLVLGTEIQ